LEEVTQNRRWQDFIARLRRVDVVASLIDHLELEKTSEF
jgi:hypothetical protein